MISDLFPQVFSDLITQEPALYKFYRILMPNADSTHSGIYFYMHFNFLWSYIF